MSDAILVYVTTAGEEEARRIGRALVEKRLAACANIVPAIRSVYRWEGKVVEDGETLLLLKSTRDMLPELTAAVRELHSYSVPCVTAFDVVGGNADYIQWVADSVGPESRAAD
mgnify:CR=1 FL=1